MINFLKQNFETFINVAMVICLFALISFLIYQSLYSRPQQVDYERILAEGNFLAEVPKLNEENYEQSIILVLNTDCRYCEESLGFYKRLAKSKSDNEKTQIVALFLESEDVVDKYVKEKDFPIRTISGANFEKLKVGLTPTIIIVNRQKQILKSWFGQLKTDAEQEVINFIEK